MDNKKYSIGFLELLFTIFIVLKLCNVIDWSWWIVTAPMWIQLVIIVVAICVAYFVGLVKDKKKKARVAIVDDE